MDFAQNDKAIGRIIIGLYGEIAPKTVANFRKICIDGINGKSYAGSPIHRVIDKFIIQGLLRQKISIIYCTINNCMNFSKFTMALMI